MLQVTMDAAQGQTRRERRKTAAAFGVHGALVLDLMLLSCVDSMLNLCRVIAQNVEIFELFSSRLAALKRCIQASDRDSFKKRMEKNRQYFGN